MEDIYKFNPNASYKPNGGQDLQVLSAKDLYKQKIVVSEVTSSLSENFNQAEDAKIFPATFPNIFVQYPLGGVRTTDEKWINWKNNPFNCGKPNSILLYGVRQARVALVQNI